MERFRKLGLSNEIISHAEKAKYENPSEIQEKAIPLILEGKDVIGGSATGSGKTFAFGAPIIDKIEKGKGVQALILTPTRELAEQITKVLDKFSGHKNIEISAVYGGVGINPQIRELETAEIVVGTPGRILDHLERRTINLHKVKTLVLDEADRMFDMGFIHDVEKIISHCPKERQTLMFSATINQDIDHIVKKHMNYPVEVSVESYVDASKLKQIYYDVPRNVKFSLLVHLLKNEKAGLVMVFCNTRDNTDFVANNLGRNGIDAMAIHGGLSQEKRNRIMEKFHTGRVLVLVCTDVAARGLDIKNVSHVYNYDIPKTSQEYIHRIGRTARAGNEGVAINLVADRDYENFRRVLEDDSIKPELVQVPEVERAFLKIHFDKPRGRFGGRGFRGGGDRSPDYQRRQARRTHMRYGSRNGSGHSRRRY
jgi:ATP-dependent RNA helicase DeaD